MDKIALSRDVQSLFTNSPNDTHFTRIGSGNNRIVYQIKTDKYGDSVQDAVVKVDLTGTENMEEHRNWNKLGNAQIGDHLVPVENRSDDFSWILMPYYRPVKPSLVDEQLYQRLSSLGSDISRTDFVEDRENDRQMCCDYATLSVDNL